jgi:hypothetical protein
MTKPKLIAELAEWTRLKKKLDAINTEADGQLEDLLVTFEKKAEPIYAERDRKAGAIIDEMNRIETDVRGELLRQVKPDGAIGIPQLESENGGLAQVLVDKKREIDPAAFFRAVPPRRRHEPAFLGCLTVQVGKAEKCLDQATMSRIARLKISPSVNFTLKN